MRGLVRANLGRAAEAANDFERFLELAPDDPRAGKVRQAISALRGR